jgi:hypothetical protein
VQTKREQALDLQDQAEKLFKAYKEKSSYQRVVRKDTDVIAFTFAVQFVLDLASIRLNNGHAASACEMLGNLVDDLYERGRQLPLPFLDY